MNPKVDAYLKKTPKWREEMEKLRTVLLDASLTEELKWGKPCYSHQGGNVVILIGLKECCAVAFCKGALLKDGKGVLVKPGENTQAGRWLKFTSVGEIAKAEPILKSYLQEAIEIEEAGLEVAYKAISDFAVPDELQKKFREDPALQTAFQALTPGRQRGYLLHFSAAKQSTTRESRIAKWMPRILAGKGLNDP